MSLMNLKAYTNISYMCYVTICTDLLMHVHSKVCEVGRERNQLNEWKYVLAYPNICECTQMIMGGIITWTPKRSFTPMYGDNILLIMNNFRRQCEGLGKIYENLL